MQGFFGKIPSHGDFVTRNLPRDFLDGWDAWLQRAIAQSKSELGDAWLDTYLTSPIWRFVLVPGVCGEKGWAGILMTSVDKVGRYFPLTIASSLHEDAHPFQIVEEADDWFNNLKWMRQFRGSHWIWKVSDSFIASDLRLLSTWSGQAPIKTAR